VGKTTFVYVTFVCEMMRNIETLRNFHSTRLSLCLCLCIYVCMHACIRIAYVYPCMYVHYIHAYMHVCMHMHTHTHTHTHTHIYIIRPRSCAKHQETSHSSMVHTTQMRSTEWWRAHTIWTLTMPRFTCSHSVHTHAHVHIHTRTHARAHARAHYSQRNNITHNNTQHKKQGE
jgi:hypothetical protein